MSVNKQKGFTLIELVMVIVILGVLSAFALPRFADLSGEAELASLEGARGSVKSALGIVRATALATGAVGTTAAPASVTMEGAAIDVVNGYLAASSVATAAQLDDFDVIGSGTTIVVATANETGKPCFIFRQSAGVNRPSSVTDIGALRSNSTCRVP